MQGQPEIFHTAAQIGDAAFSLYRVDFALKPGKARAAVCEDELRHSQYINRYHSHFYYEMHIVTEGNTRLCVDQTEYQISAGNIFIIPPQTSHFAIVRTDSQAASIVLCLRMEQKEGQTGEYACFLEALKQNSCLARTLSPELLRRFVELYTVLEGTRFRDHCRRKMLALEVLVGMFEEFDGLDEPGTFTAAGNMSDKALFELEGYICAQETYSLHEIAEKLGYVPRHTARLIRQLYGKNLQEIRQQSSIAAVRRLIALYPDMSLREIAEKTGFSGVYSMNRAFLESEGCLPADVRENRTEESIPASRRMGGEAENK